MSQGRDGSQERMWSKWVTTLSSWNLTLLSNSRNKCKTCTSGLSLLKVRLLGCLHSSAALRNTGCLDTRSRCEGSRMGLATRESPQVEQCRGRWLGPSCNLQSSQTAPSEGGLPGQQQSLVTLLRPYPHIRCCRLTASGQGHRKSAPAVKPDVFHQGEETDEESRCAATRSWRATPIQVWRSLKWDPWGFTLWNNQVCSSLHRLCLAP